MTQKKKKKKTGLDIVRQMDKSLRKKIILDEFHETYVVEETKEERIERNRQRAIEQYTPILEKMGIDMDNVTFAPFRRRSKVRVTRCNVVKFCKENVPACWQLSECKR